MKVIISPAKKLSFSSSVEIDLSEPLLTQKSEKILSQMKKKSIDEIKKLMKLSDDLSKLNYTRYQEFKTTNQTAPAGFAFAGDTYVGLQIGSFTPDDLIYAKSHLFILSGLYGLLRVSDEIRPYRLEMGVPLKFDGYKNLYDYWKKDIAKTINDLDQEGEPLLNLASEEYFKSVDRDALNCSIIDVKFLENKNGVYKAVGIMAKRARGSLARYVVKNRIKNRSELISFNEGGYVFDKKLSSESEIVFKR